MKTTNNSVSNPHLIDPPLPGESAAVVVEGGVSYRFGFGAGDVLGAVVRGGDVVLSLKDGSVLVLKGYAGAAGGSEAASFAFADGGSLGALMAQMDADGSGDETAADTASEGMSDDAARAASDEAALEVRQIKPASGTEADFEQLFAKNLLKVEPAAGEDFPQIEPAAGPSDRGGLGYLSSFSADDLNGLNALGALDGTEQTFVAPLIVPERQLIDPVNIPQFLAVPSALVDETNLVANGLQVSGQVQVDFGTDFPGAITTNDTFSFEGSALNNALTSNGDAVTVAQDGNGYVGTAGGRDVFTLTLDADTGEYVFTLLDTLDHADPNNPNDDILLNFGVVATDADGDAAPTTIQVTVRDDAPLLLSQPTPEIDETDGLTNNVVSGTFNFDSGNDEPATIDTTGDFSFSGSVLNNALTSNGDAVTVTETATGYVGTADGRTVFTLTLNKTTGAYDFALTDTLDHADGTDPNDDIVLTFGASVTDFDGDTTEGPIMIRVFDDAPRVATPAESSVDETNLGPVSVSGSVSVNFGEDGPAATNALVLDGDPAVSGSTLTNGVITSRGEVVEFVRTATGYQGVVGGDAVVFQLSVNDNGTYEFTQFAALDHGNPNDPNDVITIDFGVLATDFDGDQIETSIRINILDDSPVIVAPAGTVDETDLDAAVTTSGVIETNFGMDGGTLALNDTFSAGGSLDNNALSSNGLPVSVTQTATGYVGTAGGETIFTIDVNTATGAYEFTLLTNLDHADGSDPNDVITLSFGVTATDGDGNTADADVVINVLDDAPEAFDDGGQVAEFGDPPITGNVLDNDDVGFDANAEPVVSVRYGGQDYPIAAGSQATVEGQFGTLVIGSDGAYTYTPKANIEGTDQFQYTIEDSDEDQDSATAFLSIGVDGVPVILNGPIGLVDETDFNPTQTIRGQIEAEFGQDGPSDNPYQVKGADSFEADGSLLNGQLTSQGQDVNVTVDGNSYVGTRAGDNAEVFRLTLNTDGTYEFTAFEPLDHGDPNDPDDRIELRFGINIEDFDGDTAMSTITIRWDDDGLALEVPEGSVDETFLGEDGAATSGVINVDLGPNGGSVAANGDFDSSGSRTNDALTSNGVPVTVRQVGGTTYIGEAGGEEVFRLDINPATLAYDFTLSGVLDHADGTNPNDVITLSFGVSASRNDGTSQDAMINIRVLDDAPEAFDDSGQTANPGETITDNVLNNDTIGNDTNEDPVVSIRFDGIDYPVTPGQITTVVGTYGTLTIDSKGTYTYTPLGNTEGTDEFQYTIQDGDTDQDSASAFLSLSVNGVPEVPNGPIGQVDETDFAPNQVITGNLEVDFGTDGPAATDPYKPADASTFTAGGSLANGQLTSCGMAVNVSVQGDSYVGIRSGDNAEVFRLTLNDDGSYSFTANEPLDHADSSDANDRITLNFGVIATDFDGDSAVTDITIRWDDDGPIAQDDANKATEGAPITGNIFANDDIGTDEDPSPVTEVTFNGTATAINATGNTTINATNGTLVINAQGQYTYTPKTGREGTDSFGYTITDKDGDTADATFSFSVDNDDIPEITVTTPEANPGNNQVDETGGFDTVTGVISVDYGQDGPGTVSLGQQNITGLTSCDLPVSITQSGNTVTGTRVNNGVTETVFTLNVQANGQYTFTQLQALDHADPTNPDDFIDIPFAIVATDTDGDTDTETLRIRVRDDGPDAVNDPNRSIEEGQAPLTGNIFANDDIGQDGHDGSPITSVTLNGTTTQLNASGNTVINGQFGTLTINALGQYSYAAKNNVEGRDNFSYTIEDKDGDTDTATFSFSVSDDDQPEITVTTPEANPGNNQVDETGGFDTVTGVISVDYGQDGPGTVSLGQQNITGLSSCDLPVSITQSGNTVTGTRVNNGVTETVFTLNVQANGQYTFTQLQALDHPNASNPDDFIDIPFAIVATDTDGDTDTETLRIRVRDDGPEAVNDPNRSIEEGQAPLTGNIFANDDIGQDGHDGSPITSVTLNGQTTQLNASGNTVINGQFGTLTINALGQYSYAAKNNVEGRDNFSYTIEDKDGDTDTATFSFSVSDDDQPEITVTTPEANPGNNQVDETGGFDTVSGTITVDYGSDGPGTVSLGTQNITGLSSCDLPVSITQSGNTVTGTRVNNGVTETVFTLNVQANGQYTFTQLQALDHPNASNPDDFIDIPFAIVATDTDGDTDTETLRIRVRDDGPEAVNDPNRSIEEGQAPLTGNIFANDDIGQDGHDGSPITSVTLNGQTTQLNASGNTVINGQFGTLTINALGQYSYAAKNNVEGRDNFSYTIEDKDGDTDTATFSFTVSDDDQPEITVTTPEANPNSNVVDETGGFDTVTGVISVDYGQDGPGTVSLGQQNITGLTSCDLPVSITQSGNTVTGTRVNNGVTETVFTLNVQANGQYTFTQLQALDHPDSTDPDDFIDIPFAIVATDTDGDTDTETLRIRVRDDGPDAVNDPNRSIEEGQAPLTGNIFANDDIGQDGHDGSPITSVTLNGQTTQLNASGNTVINGQFGTLTINALGQYSYAAKNNVEGRDNFSYTIEDKDGDTDTATFSFSVSDDDQPEITVTTPEANPGNNQVDETGGFDTVSGTITVDYGSDGPGTVSLGTQNITGLSSCDLPVSITQSGNTVTGTRVNNGVTETVFTLNVQANGQYTFTQLQALDHPNASNPDDFIDIPFAIVATDTDGDTDTETLRIRVRDDGPEAVNDPNRSIEEGQAPLTGNIFANDDIGQDGHDGSPITSVTLNGQTTQLNASGNTVINGQFGTLTINALGQYSYAAKNNVEGRDNFSYTIEDKDGDTDTATFSFSVSDDDQPEITVTTPEANPGNNQVDETGGFDTVTGVISVDYGQDGPGTVSLGQQNITGLTSCDLPVSITQSGNTVTGTRVNNGVTETVFTLNVQANGQYTFTQLQALDHADPTNPDDFIDIPFAIVATDTDGDTDTETLRIRVRDDGPDAVNDPNRSIEEGQAPLTGNIFANDDIGQDGHDGSPITSVTLNGQTTQLNASGNTVINGQFGTLTINALGQYSYAAKNNVEGRDNFSYTIEDKDGDTDTATFSFTVSDDDQPEITVTTPEANPNSNVVDETGGFDTVTGVINVDYGSDGPGTVSLGTQNITGLSSCDLPVSITQSGNTVTGTRVNNGVTETVFTLNVQANGQYTFTQLQALDHPNASNPDDFIDIPFAIVATDTDGDTDTETLRIRVRDDGPEAVNDPNRSIEEGQAPLTGNIFANDDIGQDGHDGSPITSVTLNGQTTQLNASGNTVINGQFGTLTINALGQYSYAAKNNVEGRDNFSYTIEDKDGDTDTATFSFSVSDDDQPEITVTTPEANPGNNQVDETGGFDTVSGTITVDYGSDGPGTVSLGTQNITGLSSCDLPVSITQSGNTVTGTRVNNGVTETVFTLNVQANGQYTFTQLQALDHPNASNPDDFIDIPFAIVATDTDGDTDTETLRIRVRDDGPEAVNDPNRSIEEGQAPLTGNIFANDDIGQDGHDGSPITRIDVNNGARMFFIPATGTTQVHGDFGVLTINALGQYSYAAKPNVTGVDTFTYTIEDKDGDTDTATFGFNVTGTNDVPVFINVPGNVVDETGGFDSVSGQITVNYGDDAPGSVMVGDAADFFVTGSNVGGLTSCGSAVNVIVRNGMYVGVRANDQADVFTLRVQANGQYTFTQLQALDHGNPNNPDDQMNMNFEIKATDGDGDSTTATLSIGVKDDGPFINSQATPLDEDALNNGDIVFNGQLEYSYGQDGAGTIDPSGAFEAKLAMNGTATTITSDNQAINVIATTDGYRGIAGGREVFSITIRDDGSYTYTQKDFIDHPASSDPNSIIWLKFGATITDKDGDQDTDFIVIDVADGTPVSPPPPPPPPVDPVNVQVIVDDVCVPEHVSSHPSGIENVRIPFDLLADGVAFVTDGSGTLNNSIQLTLSGVSSDWTVIGVRTTDARGSDALSLTFSPQSDGTFTATVRSEHQLNLLAENTDSYILLQPPPASDVDLNNVSITAEVLDSNSQVIADDAAVFDVIVDAIANEAEARPTVSQNTLEVDFDDTYLKTEVSVVFHEDYTYPDKFVLEFYDDYGRSIDFSLLSLSKGRQISPGKWELTQDEIKTFEIESEIKGILTGTGWSVVVPKFKFSVEAEIIATDEECDISNNDLIFEVVETSYTRTPPPSPLTLDLDGDGIELVDMPDGVEFDLDNDGIKDQTAWVAADDGLLALDRNGDGIINNRDELFGNTDDGVSEDGFERLAELDSNQDGVFDANDELWSDVKVWQDLDQDGVSDDGELRSLDDHGIASIDIANAIETDYHIGDSWISDESTFTRIDGSVNTIVDAWFMYEKGTQSLNAEFNQNAIVTNADFATLNGDEAFFNTEIIDSLISANNNSGDDEDDGLNGIIDISTYADNTSSLQSSINGFVDTKPEDAASDHTVHNAYLTANPFALAESGLVNIADDETGAQTFITIL